MIAGTFLGRLGLAMLGACALLAQPRFDVASMKRNTSGAERASMTGGPLPSGPFNLSGNDPWRITWTNVAVRRMMQVAYEMPADRISAPDWFDSEHYDVSATMAAATSVPDFRLMVQGLLAERLTLTAHRAMKDISGYLLEVGRGGAKLAEAKHEVAVIDPKMDQGCRGCSAMVVIDRSGYPAPRPGNPYYGPEDSFQATIVVGSRYRAAALNAQMAGVAAFLANLAGSPVADRTGLKGVYDARIEFVPPPADPAADRDPGPTLMDAVQLQLGLKLTAGKVPVDTLVVDHAEKVPTEN